jgi:hypothetical protein
VKSEVAATLIVAMRWRSAAGSGAARRRTSRRATARIEIMRGAKSSPVVRV